MEAFTAPSLVRLRSQPDRGVGVVVVVAPDACYIWLGGELKKFSKVGAWELVARGEVTDLAALQFLDADVAALEGIPEALHADIRRRWYLGSLHGSAAYQASGNRDGVANQKELSAFLSEHGIREGDSRWQRVINRGRRLYNK